MILVKSRKDQLSQIEFVKYVKSLALLVLLACRISLIIYLKGKLFSSLVLLPKFLMMILYLRK